MYLMELHGQNLLCAHQPLILLEGSFWTLFRYTIWEYILVPNFKMQISNIKYDRSVH
jgi:hypothetical protein